MPATPQSRRTAGFEMLTALGVVTLTPCAFGVGENLPVGSPCATITSLPFFDAGDTSGLDCNGSVITNDYDEVCPYEGSTSPEIFYTLTPDTCMDRADGVADGLAGIIVVGCESAYDNKIYVYDESLTAVACVDDACTNSNGDAFRARTFEMFLEVGSTYSIAMDGWGGEAGQYAIEVRTPGTFCDFDCVGDVVEDEPLVLVPPADGNNTCKTTTDAMSCNQTFCGTTGAWRVNAPCGSDADCGGEPGSCDLLTGTCVETTAFRDVDYIRLTVPVDTDLLRIRLGTDIISELFLFAEDPTCGLTEIFGVQVFACGGGPGRVDVADVEAGAYMLVVQADLSSAFVVDPDCGVSEADYELTVECRLDCPADLDGNGSVGFNDLTMLLAG